MSCIGPGVGDASVFVQLHGHAGHHTLLGVADRTELVSDRIRSATLDIRLGRRLARRAHGTFRWEFTTKPAAYPGACHSPGQRLVSSESVFTISGRPSDTLSNLV